MESAKERFCYDEEEVSETHEVKVKDIRRFVEEMLRYYVGKGTLYVSSYDFGYWADSLSNFRSGEKVRLKTSLPDPAYLENGYAITDDFVYVFRVECLGNIDPASMFNQLLIFRNGYPLLECCCNFGEVFVNEKAPRAFVKRLIDDGIVESWN